MLILKGDSDSIIDKINGPLRAFSPKHEVVLLFFDLRPYFGLT